MDTDDDVSTLGDEEVTLSDSEATITPKESDAMQWDGTPQASVPPCIIQPLPTDIEELPIGFRIVSARTNVANKCKYVVYTVMVERGDRGRPALLERRYSEFHSLYRALKHSYPGLMIGLEFPRRVLLGNFSAETITERSRAFELCLQHIYARDVLRCSEPFANFLYHVDLCDISRLLLHSQFEAACPVLENTLWLVENVRGDRGLVGRLLCQLSVCLHAVGHYEQAQVYAEMALAKFSGSGGCDAVLGDLHAPLLHFCVQLWWVLGKNRTELEEQLAALMQSGHKVDGLPSLLDVLREDISLPVLHS